VLRAIGNVVCQPSVAALIANEFDRILTGSGNYRETRRPALVSRVEKAEAKRDRLLRMAADGLCSEVEAHAVLAECRREIDTVAAELDQLRFESRRADRLHAERDRLLALALGFPARAQQLEGRALRELLKPWVESATLDKANRKLVIEIRRVPADGAFIGLYSGPGLPSPSRCRLAADWQGLGDYPVPASGLVSLIPSDKTLYPRVSKLRRPRSWRGARRRGWLIPQGCPADGSIRICFGRNEAPSVSFGA
jgi:hypothetical protein